MLLNRAGNLLAVPLIILIATAAYGTPTPSVHSSDVLVHASHSSEYANVLPASVPETNQISEAYNSHLANIADELLKPPTDFTDSAVSLSIQPMSLPPVPGALFMALSGFLCVSLVKDRKVWMAALAGLLWAGQAGFAAMPQLAHYLANRKPMGQLAPADLSYIPELLHCDRVRSDIEGTQYIGLLHYLEGIPAVRNSKQSPQFAIIGQLSHLPQVTICLAYEFRQFFCFSPAFIFESLPRGPPFLT